MLGIILIFTLNYAKAQDNNEYVLDRYYDLDINYFFQEENSIPRSHLYQAFQFYIEGDTDAYIDQLKLAHKSAIGERKKKIAELLFTAYVDNGEKKKAFQINSEQRLGIDESKNTKYALSDFGPASIQMYQDTVELNFDQFYFNAVVNQKDSIRVMLDTGAPGITVTQELVEQYNWRIDKSYSGTAVLASFGIRYQTYPVLIPELKIGDVILANLTANYGEISEEDQAKLSSSGFEQADIIMGLDVFYGLVDKILIDYPNNKMQIVKHAAETEEVPNYMVVSGKPAIVFTVGDKKIKAFIDTGSPRHVFTAETINDLDVIDKRSANYGTYEFDLYMVEIDHLLNQAEIILEAADYGYMADKTFKINHLFGSFTDLCLSFDLKNRIIKILDTCD